ncbi:MAG: AAA family ATPase [Cyanobacteriota bacterium]|nr:AAA family ATPase [Cyanobacteriota bacterium]
MITLPGFCITKQIYTGFRTLAYRGLRKSDGQPVVIKVLRNEYPSFNELAQFRNEYALGKKLDHPHIVKTYSLEPYRNRYALIVEDFGGISLKEWMGKQPPSVDPIANFLEIALQIAAALEELYRYQIVHKDIQPANILINPTTQAVKLIDFSIASVLPREQPLPINPNIIEGTLAYMSPEQTGRMNRGVDYRTDFYSLGVTAYELLTGRLPFSATEPMEWVHCHIAKQPLPLQDLNLSPQLANTSTLEGSLSVAIAQQATLTLPQVLEAIVFKLMAKNAEERYQSAFGLKRDLEICLQQWQQSEKIQTFELGSRDISDRFTIPEKLYGRQQEVSQLLAAFDRIATESKQPVVGWGTTVLQDKPSPSPVELILVTGFSGIGKTAVIHEVHKPIARQRGYFIQGKFDQLSRNIPFGAFVQAFRDLVGQLLGESRDRLQQRKTQLLNALGQDARVLVEVIPELERIVGPQPPATELSPEAAQKRFNLLFEKFIGIFARTEHPLVLFLDDLQWSDAASLKLLQLLMGKTENQSLLLIGAYRDNEVSAAHPLMLTLDEIRRRSNRVNQITLAPLPREALGSLVADTLSCSRQLAAPLTDLILHKTQGNPFFVHQFLKTLHDEGPISFDYERGCWQCDIARVRELAITDDVVEFMALQLQKLPPATCEVLKLGACLGNRFDIADLALAREESPIATEADLAVAVEEGLVFPKNDYHQFLRELPSDSADSLITRPARSRIYQFLHDRVQQAAYLLIPEDLKAQTHLKIGKLLLEAIPERERDPKIFEIVNPLNLGRKLVRDATEREQLARLNLSAGRKAKAATAYTAASSYFTIGQELLEKDCWEHQYDLAFALYAEAAEAAYSKGDFNEMEARSLVALQHAQNIADTVRIYTIKIQAYSAQNQLLEAVKIGLSALDLLGFPLSEEPAEEEIARELEAIRHRLSDKTVASLVELPPMEDTTALAAMKILSRITPAVYMAAPQLYPLVVGRQVNLSLDYGNTPTSAYAYSSYGLSLCGAIADVETGYQFGKLALNLLERYSLKEFKARTLLVVNLYIFPWKEPLRATLESLRSAYSEALDAGNTETAGYCAVSYCYHSYFAGKILEELDRDMALLSEALQHLNLEASLGHIAPYRQAVLNLTRGTKLPWEFTGPVCDATHFLPDLLRENDLTGIFYFYLNQLILCYLFREFDRAIECARQAEQFAAGASSSMSLPVFRFYKTLTLLARSRPGEALDADIRSEIAAYGEKMSDWMQHAPMNFAHKFYLIEAERHRVLGERVEAMELYDRAIAAAHKHQYPQEEALANELAAQFYLDWGKEKFARLYLLEAYYCYARWGAKAKVDDLERRYPALLATALNAPALNEVSADEEMKASLSMHNTLSTVTSAQISQAIDLAAITKVYQALSSEIQLERLLSTLMRVVLENAGAERGALILPEGQDWNVMAVASAGQAETVFDPFPLETASDLPVSLVRYVQHTLKTLTIDDATLETAWAGDSYIVQRQPKSLLCAPLLDRGKLLGLLYLENQLTAGAFTNERVEVLNLLCAQAAISLENARLYQNLQSSLDELQAAQLQVVQSEKMSALGNLVAGVAHEINNPLGFIEGNLHLALDYVQDIFGLISLYQEHYPQPAEAVEEEIETIELDYLQEDFPKLLHSMEQGADRIRNISTSLRIFSRADSDAPVSFDLHEGIDSTLLILKHRLKANGARGAIDIVKEYGEVPQLEGFPGQLNQVFMNILANAIDALEESAETIPQEQRNPEAPLGCITIETEAINENDRVCIRIRDNGAGMEPQTQHRIFDRMFTTKAVGKGTGLGLSIARQIVEDKHGGAIACSSTLGQGTEFAIALPIRQ